MRTRTPRAAAPTLAAALIATFPHLALAQDARTGDAEAPSMETADVLQDDPVVAEDATPGPDADTDAAPTEDPGRTATRTTSPVMTSDAAVADAAGEATRRLEENAADPVAEAAEALDLTAEAIRALGGENPRSALPLVEDAVGRLEVLIARRPSLVLAPADTEVLERDLFAALPTVEALRKRIEDLVDDDRIQEARELMRDFGSEIVLRTTNLPLAAYADGLKTAARLVDEGDVGGALLVLEAVLTQVVVTETVLPLPNLRAEFLLLAAEERLTSEATEEDRAEAERLLDDAREQIELGRAYGYGTRRDYRALLDEIDRIEDEVRGAPVARAFENVRGRLARLFD